MPASVRRLLGLLLLGVSLPVFLWGIIPMEKTARSVSIQPVGPTSQDESADLLKTLEGRRLEMEWPEMLRLGEAGSIRLALAEPDRRRSGQPSRLPSGENAAWTAKMAGEYHVMAEARLELAQAQSVPPGEISEPLLPGQPVVFIWQATADQPGIQQGVIWVHLRFIPRQASTGGPLPEIRRVLTAQRFEIRSVTLLGLNGAAARILGAAGLLVSVYLLLPGLVKRFFPTHNQE